LPADRSSARSAPRWFTADARIPSRVIHRPAAPPRAAFSSWIVVAVQSQLADQPLRLPEQRTLPLTLKVLRAARASRRQALAGTSRSTHEHYLG
jgi:hypothetical protein